MKYLIVLLLCIVNYANASLDDLYKAFNKFGMGANISPTKIYQGQEGSFVHGGSMIVTAPQKDFEMFHTSPPHLGIGDCSFDLHFGGLDFVNSKQLKEMGKSIVSSSAAYAMSLALKQLSPQIMNQIEAMQAMANEANFFNINSCEAGKRLVNGVGDMLQSASQQTCRAKYIKGDSNEYGGPLNARERCNGAGVAKQAADEAANDAQMGDFVIINKNIVWDIISNSPSLNALDEDTKYLLMSLSGTLVISQEFERVSPTIHLYPSKIESDEAKMLEALSVGDKINVWACSPDDTSKCLKMLDKQVSIKPDETFIGQVRKTIYSIEKKVINDDELSEEEIDFIASTSLPIYKLIKVQTAFNRNLPLSFVHEYVELIAMDMLYKYMEKSLGDIVQAYGNKMLPEKIDEKFFRMTDSARRKIRSLRVDLARQSSQKYEMVTRVQSLERQLSSVVSSQISSSMGWGQGLRN